MGFLFVYDGLTSEKTILDIISYMFKGQIISKAHFLVLI